jgi:uncharacterized protein
MFKKLCIVAALAAGALVIDAFFVEPYRIEVTHTSLAAAIDAPLKIALIADIHTRGFGLRERKLMRLLNTESPDVIVIAGDSVGRDNDYGDVIAVLRHLHAPLGVWLVRGNRENRALPRNERALYASAGVHFLLNEAKPIRPDVWLLGLDDPSSGRARPDPALESVPNGAYTIAVFHAPAYFDRIAARVPLVLAGHTHGGQIRIPFVPPFWLPRGSGRFLAGLYTEGNSHVYVTRGIGTSVVRARFLCRPELSILTLEPAPGPNRGETAQVGHGGLSIGLPQVTPFDVTVQAGSSYQFSATVPCTNPAKGNICPQGIIWSSSLGAVSGVGTFKAPLTAGKGTIRAASSADPSKVGTAAVTVVAAIPIAQTCRARQVNVNWLSCSLPSLARGHTLVAVARAHGVFVQITSFADSADGIWPSANISRSEHFSGAGTLAGGAAFFSNTKESRSAITLTARFSHGAWGNELTVWDFPGVYSAEGAIPAPVVGKNGTTPTLPIAKAGDLVFAWSVLSSCFLDPPSGASFTDISVPESCNVNAAALMASALQANLSARFAADGYDGISGIMALTPKH